VSNDAQPRWSRRDLLHTTSAVTIATLAAACGKNDGSVRVSGEPPPPKLPPLLASSEPEKNETSELLPPDKRVGVAVVGLGRLALQQILPAFGSSRELLAPSSCTRSPF